MARPVETRNRKRPNGSDPLGHQPWYHGANFHHDSRRQETRYGLPIMESAEQALDVAQVLYDACETTECRSRIRSQMRDVFGDLME